MSLMLRCQGVDHPVTSERERALFIACEFWAATANGSLDEHLGHAGAYRLRAVEQAFEILGVPRVASVVHRNLVALSARSAAVDASLVARNIEDELLPMGSYLDARLAGIAAGLPS